MRLRMRRSANRCARQAVGDFQGQHRLLLGLEVELRYIGLTRAICE
jgi:hypothetical protein